MTLRLAARTAVPWLLVAALGAVLAGLSFHDDDADACWQATREYGDLMYKARRAMVFQEIIEDRADRWLAAHPDRECLRIEDIAAPRELWRHGYSTVELVCGNRNYRYRKIVPFLTKWKPLVAWPRPLPAFG